MNDKIAYSIIGILFVAVLGLGIWTMQEGASPAQTQNPTPTPPEPDNQKPTNTSTSTPPPKRISTSKSQCEANGTDCVLHKVFTGTDSTGAKIERYYIKTGDVLENENFDISGSNINPNQVCAEGLTPVKDDIVTSDGSCGFVECACYVCVKCPDGTCGPGENKCNCPKDCQ